MLLSSNKLLLFCSLLEHEYLYLTFVVFTNSYIFLLSLPVAGLTVTNFARQLQILLLPSSPPSLLSSPLLLPSFLPSFPAAVVFQPFSIKVTTLYPECTPVPNPLIGSPAHTNGHSSSSACYNHITASMAKRQNSITIHIFP